MNEIEKLKQERDEILAKAMKLAGLAKQARRAKHVSELPKPWDIADAIAAIEALRPKSKPLEWWANIYGAGDYTIYHSQKDAQENADNDEPGSRIAVHMREVLPAPRWERWEKKGCRVFSGVDDRTIGYADDDKQAGWFITHHNAEMERLAAPWEGGEG